ncbi:MAG: transglutaminase domain-containing protein [Anaerolineales bacterium]|nr:transglutaminase domain-containing protein [Anaerolineales bacterium]
MVALGLTLLLHLVLDQQRLSGEWVGLKLDYSPSLLLERALYALAIVGLALTVALLTPNLYVYEVTARYYTWLRPVNQGMEAVGKRLFPGVAGVMPWEPRAGGGTAANEFELGAGASQGVREVMRVRTSEPVSGAGFDAAPPGHTLRGTTYSTYLGRVWENPGLPIITQLPAEEPWHVRTNAAARRELVQSVNLAAAGGILFAASEPQAPSIDYIAQERFPGDLIALRAGARSYTVVSELPMLSAEELARVPAWGIGEAPALPEEYRIFLQLPDTVTERTRRLAAELTADAANPFAAATAIETYLRRYPYDLDVPELPDQVKEVADYFLFDLKRGYCDYYATAFVVLARLSGLPARLVTGYAPGSWSPTERLWVVTEQDAHAWPEVYFPEAGWIAFEPTAARPPLVRLAALETAGMGAQPMLEPLPPPPTEFPWLWVFAGLAVLVAVIPAVVWVQQRAGREDPWLGLLRWGKGAGRPLGEGETPLEYGKGLSEWLQTSYPAQADNVRVARHEVEALSRDVSVAQYAPARDRPAVREQAITHWQRLRQYLRKLGRR